MHTWVYGDNSKSSKAQEEDKQKRLFLMPQSLIFFREHQEYKHKHSLAFSSEI